MAIWAVNKKLDSGERVKLHALSKQAFAPGHLNRRWFSVFSKTVPERLSLCNGIGKKRDFVVIVSYLYNFTTLCIMTKSCENFQYFA